MSKSLNQGMHNHITFPRPDKINGTDILDSADQNFCAISGMASQSVVELQNKLQVLFTYIPLASFYDHPLSPPIRKHMQYGIIFRILALLESSAAIVDH